MDNLEKFIAKNREAFDSEQPSLDVWAKLNDALEKENPKVVKTIPLRFYALRLAAACFLLFVGAFVSYKYWVPIEIEEMVLSVEELAPEYSEELAIIEQQVNVKMNALANYESAHTVQDDMLQLDEAFNELLKELESVPDDRRAIVMKAVIENYKTKLDILDKVLYEVEKLDKQSINLDNEELSL